MADVRKFVAGQFSSLDMLTAGTGVLGLVSGPAGRR
jgi:hypothetical protein